MNANPLQIMSFSFQQYITENDENKISVAKQPQKLPVSLINCFRFS